MYGFVEFIKYSPHHSVTILIVLPLVLQLLSIYWFYWVCQSVSRRLAAWNSKRIAFESYNKFGVQLET
jgi:hypothetical protein